MGMGTWCFIAAEFQWEDEEVLEVDGGDGHLVI
jgi:hypothetical protein